MHELGIASEIYRVCRESVAEHGSGTLESVHVAVGELSAVEPDQLRFAWEAVTKGGPDERALLNIEWCPAKQFCMACNVARPRPAGGWQSLCPVCEGLLAVRGGDELDIIDMTVSLDENGSEVPRTGRTE